MNNGCNELLEELEEKTKQLDRLQKEHTERGEQITILKEDINRLRDLIEMKRG